MKSAPSRLPTEGSSNVYTPWERQKLQAAGLRRLSQSGALFGLFALALAAVIGRPSGGWGFAAVGSLAFGAAVALGFYVRTNHQGVDLRAPGRDAVWLCLVMSLAGAVAAGGLGGYNGAIAFGLVPAGWAWALFMPGGARAAVVPVGVSLAIHVFGTAVKTEGMSPSGAAILVLLFIGSAASIAAAEVVETWRLRTAAASERDWLTGALHAAGTRAKLEQLCGVRARELGPFALVLLDVDRFQTVNHNLGRAAGDEVLEATAAGIRAEIRGGDFYGRWGADEFLVVLDHCEALQANVLIERLRRRLDSPLTIDGEQVRVTLAAGVVSAVVGETPSAKDLIVSVERALEASRESARGRTVLTGLDQPHLNDELPINGTSKENDLKVTQPGVPLNPLAH